MLDKLYQYISDDEFRLTIYDDKIHIINFKRIVALQENNITFYSDKKKISISGYGLSLKKKLQNEMLITGKVTKIEVLNNE